MPDPHLFKLIQELSIWEISHHWHGYSPDKTDPKHLPADVQSSLRLLAVAGTRGAVFRVNPDSIWAEFIGPTFLEAYSIVLQWKAAQTFSARKFDKKLYDSIKMRREELARWCKENKIPPPSFWFPEFRCQPEQLFAGVTETIYLMRCCYFHGELVPSREASAC